MTEVAVPRPGVLNVGVTGHRAGVLTATLVRTLRPVVYSVFRELREAAERLHGSNETRLRLYTPLATGADQIAAICARSSGYFVSALLPFEPREYRKDFAPGEELDGFEQALAAADEIVALPGDRSNPEAAYVAVGEALVENADLMLAIWDGEAAKGPGGTGHVVELAQQRSVPVIHIDIEHGSDEVRMRALTGGADAAGSPWVPLNQSGVYDGVLREAFKLDNAPSGA